MMSQFDRLKGPAIIAAILTLCSIANGQISNPGFESWTAGEPDNWKTNNSDPIFFVTHSADAHGGSSAAKGVAVDFGGGFAFGALIKTGNSGSDGFPVSQRYAAVHFYYKYTGVGGDQLSATAGFTQQGNAVGAGTISDTAATASYKEAVIPIIYNDGSAVPDTAVVVISIAPLTGCHAGSTFIIDDFGLDLTTDVTESAPGIPKEFALRQNFPNPFNPVTTIRYDLPKNGHVTIKIYDLLGREVAVLADGEESAGRYALPFNGSNLGSGVYFVRMTAGSYSSVMKMAQIK